MTGDQENNITYKITRRFEFDVGPGTMEIAVEWDSTFDDNGKCLYKLGFYPFHRGLTFMVKIQFSSFF